MEGKSELYRLITGEDSPDAEKDDGSWRRRKGASWNRVKSFPRQKKASGLPSAKRQKAGGEESLLGAIDTDKLIGFDPSESPFDIYEGTSLSDSKSSSPETDSSDSKSPSPETDSSDSDEQSVSSFGALDDGCGSDSGCTACTKVFKIWDYIGYSGSGASANVFKFNVNGGSMACRAVSTASENTLNDKYERFLGMLTEDFVIAVLKKRSPVVVDYNSGTGFEVESPGLVHYVVLMDVAEYRDLAKYLGDDTPSSITGRKEEADALYGQIWHVVARVLPAAGVYHADVSGRNILVFKDKDGRPSAKLADFDMAGLILNETTPSFKDTIKDINPQVNEARTIAYKAAGMSDSDSTADDALDEALQDNYDRLQDSYWMSGLKSDIRDMEHEPFVIRNWVQTFLNLIARATEGSAESTKYWQHDVVTQLDMFSLYSDWCDRTRAQITRGDVIDRGGGMYDLSFVNEENIEAFQSVIGYVRP